MSISARSVYLKIRAFAEIVLAVIAEVNIAAAQIAVGNFAVGNFAVGYFAAAHFAVGRVLAEPAASVLFLVVRKLCPLFRDDCACSTHSRSR